MSTLHGFWVEYMDNRAFDGVVTRHLVAHGDIVVIHAFHHSDAYPFAEIVRRLRILRPGIRVLFYTWAGRKRLGAASIAAVPTLDGMEHADNFDLLIEHGSRRLLHLNVTAHPTAAWTLQQLREALGYERCYCYLIHDRDRIFAPSLDESIVRLGVAVLKSPFRSPKANAIGERLIGTIRRECLDWLIPLSESHLRSILKEWRIHYNQGRPHAALGPGVPDPPAVPALRADPTSRHRLSGQIAVLARSVLGGLHHEYFLVESHA